MGTAVLEGAPPVETTGARMLFLVRKDFAGAGHDRRPGEVVDGTDWPNTLKLVDAKYLLPYGGEVIEQRGRFWRDQETADRFAPLTRREKAQQAKTKGE